MRPRSRKLLILPILSGFLLFASFPPLSQGYLAWVSHIPVLIFLARCTTIGAAFAGGFLAGFVQLTLLLYWIPGVLSQYGSLPGFLAWFLYILLMAALAIYHALAAAVTGFCVRRGGPAFLLVYPFNWVSVELLRNYSPFGGFPWLLAGYSQTDYLRLMQVADITGVYGISLLVACANAAAAWMIVHRGEWKRRIQPALAVCCLVVAVWTYGHFSMKKWDSGPATRKAALLQGNVPLNAPDGVVEWKFGQGYVRMADALEGKAIDLLILPESPAPLSLEHDRSYREEMRKLASRFPLGLVLSNIGYSPDENDPGYFNSAYFLIPDRTGASRYDKIHLVPFGEYVPLKRFFFFLDSITREVSDFRPGREFTVVEAGGHRISALICFEAVFPNLARRFAAGGSELLVNLTNDAWYGDTAAPHQHLMMARWRAVENRRWLLRAANSGVSAVISPAGRVKASTGLFREEACVGRFDFVSHLSVYSRLGDLCAFLCVIISCLALLRALTGGPGPKLQPTGGAVSGPGGTVAAPAREKSTHIETQGVTRCLRS